MCWNFEKKKVKSLVIFKFSLVLSLVQFLVSHVMHVVENIDRRLLVMYKFFCTCQFTYYWVGLAFNQAKGFVPNGISMRVKLSIH